MHLHRSGLYFRKYTGSLMRWRRSSSAFFDAVFIRSSARPDCAGSTPLLAAATTTKRKGRVRRTLPIFLCLTLAQFNLGRLHSLPLLTGRSYLYPKRFGNRLHAREGKQPVSTELDWSFFRRDFQDSASDSLGAKRVGCLLAGSSQQRHVLPSPAPPHRRAPPRPDRPVVRPGFGFDRYIGILRRFLHLLLGVRARLQNTGLSLLRYGFHSRPPTGIPRGPSRCWLDRLPLLFKLLYPRATRPLRILNPWLTAMTSESRNWRNGFFPNPTEGPPC